MATNWAICSPRSPGSSERSNESAEARHASVAGRSPATIPLGPFFWPPRCILAGLAAKSLFCPRKKRAGIACTTPRSGKTRAFPNRIQPCGRSGKQGGTLATALTETESGAMGRKKAATAATAKPGKSNGNGANLGFEAKLWLAADKLRNNMDAAEYKHVVLGLIFLKYISDSFEEMHQRLLADQGEGADPEDADEYRAENVFWVPKEARWANLKPRPSSRPSARSWTTRWSPSSATIPGSKACCPRTTPGLRSTSNAWAN